MQLDIHRPRNIDGERKELIRRGRHLKLVVWAGVDMQLIGGIAGDPHRNRLANLRLAGGVSRRHLTVRDRDIKRCRACGVLMA